MTQQECIFALANYAAEALQLRLEKLELLELLKVAEAKVAALEDEKSS